MAGGKEIVTIWPQIFGRGSDFVIILRDDKVSTQPRCTDPRTADETFRTNANGLGGAGGFRGHPALVAGSRERARPCGLGRRCRFAEHHDLAEGAGRIIDLPDLNRQPFTPSEGIIIRIIKQ